MPSRLVRSLLASLLFCCSVFAFAADHASRWVGTWAASPYAFPNRDGKAGSADTTYREIVHVSLGGPQIRVVLSNEFGAEPLTIGGAQAALSTGQGAINTASAAVLTFNGSPSVIIPVGGMVVSDPATLNLPAFADLAVSFFVPAQPITQLTYHGFADQTSYTAPGNVIGAATLTQPTTIVNWPILKGIDVLANEDAAAVVAFGDSITDGAHSTPNTNSRWPDVLARRLQANKKTAHLAVLNQGIGGNRVLHDNAGPNALSRFDRDVLSQPGVKYVIFMEGINDIGHATDPTRPNDVVTAQDIITGLSQLAARAHIRGLKVFGATLTPYTGAKYQSPAGETMRQAINEWIRTTRELDGVIDFDKVTRDPANPAVFAAADDSGDHLHPGDAGYKAMGDAIDLNLFTK